MLFTLFILIFSPLLQVLLQVPLLAFLQVLLQVLLLAFLQVLLQVQVPQVWLLPELLPELLQVLQALEGSLMQRLRL